MNFNFTDINGVRHTNLDDYIQESACNRCGGLADDLPMTGVVFPDRVIWWHKKRCSGAAKNEYWCPLK
jgi:hypothetical protein